MVKKVLFTGGSGLLALNWAFHLQKDTSIALILHTKKLKVKDISTFAIDLSATDFEDILISFKPDLVINCAGITSVESCEENSELAFRINGKMPGKLAADCLRQNVKFVHISTDHLFSGTKLLVSETEDLEPLNIYGESKALGEKDVFKSNPEAIVVRTNFYGWGTSYRNSLSDFIIGSLRNRETIGLFDDVHYTPILIQDLADSVMKLVEMNASGIYNVVGNERITKYKFGVKVASCFGLNIDLIDATKLSDRSDLVLRPFDMSLSNSKISKEFHIKIAGIDEQIGKLYDQERNNFSKQLRSL